MNPRGSKFLEQRELGAGSPLYADLGTARDTDELTALSLFLERAVKVPHAFAKAAFVGNRGAGKSTYLLHLEKQLEDDRKFTPLHFYLDKTLEADCDYSDLLLWMVDRVASSSRPTTLPSPRRNSSR